MTHRRESSSPGGKGTVLVTGASSGVGNCIAHHLAGDFRVLAVARRYPHLVRDFADEPSVVPHRLDLADLGEVEALCDDLIEQGEQVTHIVNNAGVSKPGTIEALAVADLQLSLTINALAPLVIMQKLLPGMRERGFGRIINVTSGAPLNCFPGFAAYSGSKALLNAITVTAAQEYEDHDIRINLMSPGPVRTEMAPEAPMDPEVCLPTLDHLLELDAAGPTGRFFWLGYEVPLSPDLSGVDWLRGKGAQAMKRILAH